MSPPSPGDPIAEMPLLGEAADTKPQCHLGDAPGRPRIVFLVSLLGPVERLEQGFSVAYFSRGLPSPKKRIGKRALLGDLVSVSAYLGFVCTFRHARYPEKSKVQELRRLFQPRCCAYSSVPCAISGCNQQPVGRTNPGDCGNARFSSRSGWPKIRKHLHSSLLVGILQVGQQFAMLNILLAKRKKKKQTNACVRNVWAPPRFPGDHKGLQGDGTSAVQLGGDWQGVREEASP